MIGLENKLAGLNFRHQSSLIEADILAGLKKGACPFCGKKLYLTRNNKIYWCKSVKCPNYLQTKMHFVVRKDKLENVLRIGLRK